jgi:hypothetical protein
MSGALIRRLLVLSASLLVALSGVASGAQEYRPCRRTDLIGIWTVVRLEPGSGTTMDPSNPNFFPHQWYAFYGNGTMRHITSTQEIAVSEYRTYARSPVTTTWRLDDRGGLTLDKTAVSQSEWSLCTVIVAAPREGRAAGLMRSGDVLLTYFRGNQIAVARHLRRVRAQ